MPSGVSQASEGVRPLAATSACRAAGASARGLTPSATPYATFVKSGIRLIRAASWTGPLVDPAIDESSEIPRVKPVVPGRIGRGSPLPILLQNGERARVRGGCEPQHLRLPLTPTLSP